MDQSRLATRAEVAEYLAVPVDTLTRWAYIGTGPTYIRVGRHARYRWEDVAAWLDQQDRGGDTDTAAEQDTEQRRTRAEQRLLDVLPSLRPYYPSR